MKVIMVMYDSLNRHMLAPYGCTWTKTPNFERLAERSVTFDNFYVGSMPCMPARRELHTGRYNFLHRSWGPWEPFDDSVPAMLTQSGIYTHLVSDHYHYWEDGGATYHHRFSSWENVRGQEGDRWKGVVEDPQIPEHLGVIDRWDWINRRYMQEEALTPQARTFARGLEFLRTNHRSDRWFLQIETFDPHEPFFTLNRWKGHYPHAWDGPHFDWPRYERVSESPAAVEHLRYQYAALLTQCDHYLGQVLDLMDELELWDDTMLIVNTDHGFLLGEHDWWAKCRMPFYNEIAHIPLFIWDPRSGIRGERRQSLVQTIDIGPSLLEAFGLPRTADMQGHALRQVIESDAACRSAALFGIFGGQVNITDGRWVYMRAPRPDNLPLNHYTLMPSHMMHPFTPAELRRMTWHPGFSFTKGCPVMKIPSAGLEPGEPTAQWARGLRTELFDLSRDPQQCHPVDDPARERHMIEQMLRLMAENSSPPDQAIRLGLADRLPAP